MAVVPLSPVVFYITPKRQLRKPVSTNFPRENGGTSVVLKP